MFDPLGVEQLRRTNRGLAALHGILALLSLFPAGLTSRLATPRPVWCEADSTLQACTSCAAGRTGATPDGATGLCTELDYVSPVFIESVNIPRLCLSFFAITATAHYVYSQRAERYHELVQQRRMWWRWVEYSLSVPPMTVILCVLNGVTVDMILVQVAILGGVTQAFGAAAKALAADDCLRQAQRVHCLGYAPIVGALLPVFVSLGNMGTAPSFVPFLVLSQLLFFSSFGFIQLALLTCYGNDARVYARCDTAYLALSLVCKTSLAGSVLAASFVL